jgi:hypothetical protein
VDRDQGSDEPQRTRVDGRLGARPGRFVLTAAPSISFYRWIPVVGDSTTTSVPSGFQSAVHERWGSATRNLGIVPDVGKSADT